MPITLTGRQAAELRSLNRYGKLWGLVPRDKADPDLCHYIYSGLVEWKGDGYSLTDAGRAAIRGPAK